MGRSQAPLRLKGPLVTFRGSQPYQLDERSRVQIPARYRAAFNDGAVLVPGTEHCIEVYTVQGWEEEAAVLEQVPMESEDARQAHRAFFANSSDAPCDAQGRIVLPATLREYASIKRDVVVAGVRDRLEIWDKEAWEAQQPVLQDTRRSVLSDIARRKQQAQLGQAG